MKGAPVRRSVAPRSAPGGDWARAARSERCSGGCFGDYEGIMNGASATAFLPNFVGFPSPRGLHSSTVQPGSAPLVHMCAFTPRGLSTAKRPPGDDSRRTLMVPDGPDAVPRPELSCPVSAASAAASAPTAPAGRRDPPPQDEPPPHEECPDEQAMPPPPPEPALPAHQLLRDRRERPPPPRLAADTSTTTSTMNAIRMMPPIMASPSFRSPEAAPRGPASCVCFSRARGMPPRLADQSRVEQLQSLRAG